MSPPSRFLMMSVILHVWLSTVPAFPALPPGIWGDLTPGKFSVGFRVVNVLDSSRHGPNREHGRPMQISVWYPAIGAPVGNRLTYRDYFLLTVSELNFGETTDAKNDEAIAQYKQLLTGNGIPGEAVDRWMASPMAALRGAEPAEGASSLIIVAQGNMQSAHHQAILCEYLASHGNVVATCPSQTRISGPMQSDTDVTRSAMEQAQDIAFLRQTVQRMFIVDSSRAAILAHSFGARSALLYVARHPDIRAMVSLDGGIGSKQAKDFARTVQGFNPIQVRTPLLHFYEESDPAMTPDFALIRSLNRSDRYLVKVDEMRHLYFTSIGLAAGSIPGFLEGAAAARLKHKCGMIFAATEQFLKTFLKRDPGQKEPGMRLPEDIMHMTRLAPRAK